MVSSAELATKVWMSSGKKIILFFYYRITVLFFIMTIPFYMLQIILQILEHYKDADPERAQMHAENVLTNEKIFQFLETQ